MLVDTRVIGHHGGAVGQHSADAAAAVAEVLPRPSLVVLHHQIQRTPVPLYLPTGIFGRDGVPFLDAVAAASPRSLVTSGHTHRHRSWRRRGLRYTEVGATKDFPGVWAAYELYEGGIVQIVRRIAVPGRSAGPSGHVAPPSGRRGHWSPGRLADRSVTTGAWDRVPGGDRAPERRSVRHGTVEPADGRTSPVTTTRGPIPSAATRRSPRSG